MVKSTTKVRKLPKMVVIKILASWFLDALLEISVLGFENWLTHFSINLEVFVYNNFFIVINQESTGLVWIRRIHLLYHELCVAACLQIFLFLHCTNVSVHIILIFGYSESCTNTKICNVRDRKRPCSRPSEKLNLNSTKVKGKFRSQLLHIFKISLFDYFRWNLKVLREKRFQWQNHPT